MSGLIAYKVRASCFFLTLYSAFLIAPRRWEKWFEITVSSHQIIMQLL